MKEPLGIPEWAQPHVWTDRMLTTLLTGVRGGRWHTLIDKVYALDTLFFAARRVVYNKGAAGVEHQTVDDFSEQDRSEILRLQELLRTDTYLPSAVRRAWIPKDRLMPLVQQSISDRRVLGPIQKYLDQEIMEELSR